MTNPIDYKLPDEAATEIPDVVPRIGFISFQPVLKHNIWGGSRIRRFKGLEETGMPFSEPVGESWEISHLKADVSVVDSGHLAGKNLDELIAAYGERLLGRAVMQRFGSTFPLLIKLIDAEDDLSIQVHPDDEMAGKRHNSWGKTEMWYAIEADDKASLFSGFYKKKLSKKVVQSLLSGEGLQSTVADIMKRYAVKAGDVFFLPAGRVHAIGKGCFMAEIQQTSNVTYRIFDYDRRDSNGEKRPLHVEQAREAIKMEANLPAYRLYGYARPANAPIPLARCQYFTTNLLRLERTWTGPAQRPDSFIIYMCISGKVSMLGDGAGIELRQGQTVLVPAEMPQVTIVPENKATLLEIYCGDFY
ncbi:MAG: class I mannose-6-phosphate isomerase [Tannerellaceae bacterium]|jgi:mannose-6-phosphate isomerase|nr:class I mannose-6-phosphate isomerase [Tannerellaceae bacterium]